MRTADTRRTPEETELRSYVAGGPIGVLLLMLVFFAVDALTGLERFVSM